MVSEPLSASSLISFTVPICWAFCLSASRVTWFTTSEISGLKLLQVLFELLGGLALKP